MNHIHSQHSQPSRSLQTSYQQVLRQRVSPGEKLRPCARVSASSMTMPRPSWAPKVLVMLAVLLATTSLFKTSTVHAENKLGVVDLQRAINETDEGRKAKNKLKGEFDARQKKLDGRQEDLKKMKENIERQKSVLSKEALQSKLETYQQSFVELQSTYVQFQKEIAEKERVLTDGILQKMQAILRRIGQSEGYTVIMERNEGGVVWSPSHLDLTDRLIQLYNSENKGTPSKKPVKKGAAKKK